MDKDNVIAKAKEKALKKIEKTLQKSLKSLAKDINAVLKEAAVWYCSDDWIKSHEELHTPNDRNGDQVILDYASHILNGGELWAEDAAKLWTKEEIEA